MNFTKAVRKNVPVKVGLIGPSGSGKTLSALKLACGLGGRTVLIDTEAGRGLYYADSYDYDYARLDAPFAPESYIEAIGEAYKAGFRNIIVDSASHEWIGKGGCLEIHTAVTNADPKHNGYTAWEKVTPRHNRFIETIVRCPVNLILTLRGKDEYVLEEGANGKKSPKKVGVGAQMRDGLEYECTVAFMVDQDTHYASATKDLNGMFQTPHVITEETGVRLAQWSNSGASATENK